MQVKRYVSGILPRDRNTNTQFLLLTDDGDVVEAEHAGQVLVQFEIKHFVYPQGHHGKHAVGVADLAGVRARVAVPFKRLPAEMRDLLDGGDFSDLDRDAADTALRDEVMTDAWERRNGGAL